MSNYIDVPPDVVEWLKSVPRGDLKKLAKTVGVPGPTFSKIREKRQPTLETDKIEAICAQMPNNYAPPQESIAIRASQANKMEFEFGSTCPSFSVHLERAVRISCMGTTLGRLERCRRRIADAISRRATARILFRPAELPDVPPVADTVPGFDGSNWSIILAPAGTPSDVVDRLRPGVQQEQPKSEQQSADGVVAGMSPPIDHATLTPCPPPRCRRRARTICCTHSPRLRACACLVAAIPFRNGVLRGHELPVHPLVPVGNLIDLVGRGHR